MTFYHKALIDGSECYQVQGYFEQMTPEEAATRNRRARLYCYVPAKVSPAVAVDCVGSRTVYPGGIDHYLSEYKKRIRQGKPRGMQVPRGNYHGGQHELLR